MLDVETGEWAGPPRVGHDGPILTVDYAPDGATFATGADDGAIVLWDADTGAPLNRVLPGRPTDGGMNPTFLADGHTVLIASSGGADLHDGHQARTLDRGRLRHRRTQPHRRGMERRLRRPPLPRDLPAEQRDMSQVRAACSASEDDAGRALHHDRDPTASRVTTTSTISAATAMVAATRPYSLLAAVRAMTTAKPACTPTNAAG